MTDEFEERVTSLDILNKFRDVLRHGDDRVVTKAIISRLERLGIVEYLIAEKGLEINKEMIHRFSIDKEDETQRQRDNILMDIIVEILSTQEG